MDELQRLMKETRQDWMKEYKSYKHARERGFEMPRLMHRNRMQRASERYASIRQGVYSAAALAEAQAENARLRAALEAIAKSAETAIARATATPQNQHLYSRACGWDAAATIARAALETAPAGEASNGNG